MENNEGYNPSEEEKEIDLLDLFRKLLKRKKTIGIWCLVGLVLGLVIAFSIPREYTTSITLAPESNGNPGSSSGLGALAAMAGVGNTAAGGDAVSPQLYPDLLKSVPFSIPLLDIPLTDKEGKRQFTLGEYLENDMRSPWWSVITGAPGMIISALKPSNDSDDGTVEREGANGPIIITKDQDNLLKTLNSCLTASVDIKTSVISINVRMQDPMVSAIVADSVANRLKEYIADYRTNKARQDLEYVEKLNNEARETYYNAQQKYANYLDTHQGIVLYSAQTMRDRLENEATLAFNVFNQTSQQLQMAKAKVQEETPVFATIEPAVVPLKPSAPRKVLILAGFIFLAFVGACAWILFIEPLKAQLKEEDEKEKMTEGKKDNEDDLV